MRKAHANEQKVNHPFGAKRMKPLGASELMKHSTTVLAAVMHCLMLSNNSDVEVDTYLGHKNTVRRLLPLFKSLLDAETPHDQAAVVDRTDGLISIVM